MSEVESQWLERGALQRLLDALRGRGFRILGPTLRGGATTFDEIHVVGDLPIGRRDTQSAGAYSLEEVGNERAFGVVNGPGTLKPLVFAPRESLITFIGDRIAAVRWRQWRLYPRTVLPTPDVLETTGVQAIVAENNGYPAAYNIEWDPREQWNLLIENSWLLGPYMKVIQDYRKTLQGHPNPAAPNFTKY